MQIKRLNTNGERERGDGTDPSLIFCNLAMRCVNGQDSPIHIDENLD